MELCEKKYPYPVLLPTGDDYVNSQFEVRVEAEKTTAEIVLRVDVLLKCPSLQELVEAGSAAVILHIECPQSAYRHAFPLKIGHNDLLPLSTDDLSGKIFLCPFIVAQQDIEGYASEDFNPVYRGLSFTIRCGAVLAEGEQITDFADTATRDLDYKSDIFSVYPYDPAPEDKDRIKIHTGDNKLKIALPRVAYAQYTHMMDSGDIEFARCVVILPAVMEALYQMRMAILDYQVGFGELESYIWCQRLNERIETLYPASKGDKLEFYKNMDIPEVAQDTIRNPVFIAFQKYAVLGDKGEKSDED